jgi:uncharacterized protein (DUF2252 family)
MSTMQPGGPRARARGEASAGSRPGWLTPAERASAGRAARRAHPRSMHAVFEPASSRPDPISLLEQQGEARVPELLPIRYGRMLTSPFAFYRGAALIMASDVGGAGRTGLEVQLCGDAHLANFGVFGSPERRMVFDINDFDETLPGPFEWDVKRLAASLEVAARENGYTTADRRSVVQRTTAMYRRTMRQFATMRNLDVWYAQFDIEERMVELRRLATKSMLRNATRTLAKARTRDSLQAFAKLARIVDGEPRIIADPPLIEPIEDLAGDMSAEELMAALRDILDAYRRTLQADRRLLLEQFRLVHVARKVVGVGSVGTRAWIALLLGRDDQDPLFLQLKEAGPSVLEGFARKSPHSNSGERVVAGQRLMQASSDIFLGWCHVRSGLDGRERDFYGRQLRDWKGSAVIETMTPLAMALYGELCGWTLARAHARSGDRIAIAVYLGGGDAFDRAICNFAAAYADQNQRDYEALVTAVEGGRITAVTGL